MAEAILHIYGAAQQPATNWVDGTFNPPRKSGYAPGALIWCECSA